MKRMAELKKEKEKVLMELDQEQEFLTNNLQRDLARVKRERDALEEQLNSERAYIEDDLMKRVNAVHDEKQFVFFHLLTAFKRS